MNRTFVQGGHAMPSHCKTHLSRDLLCVLRFAKYGPEPTHVFGGGAWVHDTRNPFEI